MPTNNSDCILCKAYCKPDGSIKIYYHDDVCCIGICPKCNEGIVIYKNHFSNPLRQKDKIKMINTLKRFGSILHFDNDINPEHYIIHFTPQSHLEIAKDIEAIKKSSCNDSNEETKDSNIKEQGKDNIKNDTENNVRDEKELNNDEKLSNNTKEETTEEV